MGRPSLYKPEYDDLLITHMEQGYSFEAFAGRVKVGRTTINDWLVAHPSFAEAKDIAVERGRFYWEGENIRAMWRNNEFEPKVNTTLMIFTLKNRFGWRDRVEIEHTDYKNKYDVDQQVLSIHKKEY